MTTNTDYKRNCESGKQENETNDFVGFAIIIGQSTFLHRKKKIDLLNLILSAIQLLIFLNAKYYQSLSY